MKGIQESKDYSSGKEVQSSMNDEWLWAKQTN